MKVKIANKLVGEGEPCFVIAEAGANHNGDVEIAKSLVIEAAKNGADAVKFQTYTAEKLVTRTAPKYWVDRGEPGGTQFSTFEKLDSLTETECRQVFELAKEMGILFLSTPFDEESADFLQELGVPAFKIASADITHHPLISHVAAKRLPMIVSTGLATVGEIEEAVSVMHQSGNDNIVLLHCVLSYPTAPKDANLSAMVTLQRVFPRYPIGFSDHTIGLTIPIAAVALGAKVIEKHFTVDKSLPDSPDHPLSVDPRELRDMVESIRRVEEALGSDRKGPVEAEKEAFRYARRSIVASVDIRKGTRITREMLTYKRPGTGIPPKFIDVVIGREAKRDVKEDEVVTWEHV